MSKKQRAAGYVRVSQERAVRNGYGLDAQEADIRRYAEYRQLRLVGLFREEGVSGYERERPALEKLLAAARSGEIDVAVFPSIDRAGRSVRDLIEIDAALREAGVDVVFMREGIDTSTPVGEFFRNVMASLAQLEGRIIADRLMKGRRRKAAQGGYVGGWLPYGYELVDGRAKVVAREAAVVRRVFRWSGEGRSLRWIAGRLDAQGAPTRKGGRWHASTVRGILGNATYRDGRSVAGLKPIVGSPADR
ncbi:MAG: recombinase family protein [Planctomycetota bacterium]|jgi:site-specific DNA recombinase